MPLDQECPTAHYLLDQSQPTLTAKHVSQACGVTSQTVLRHSALCNETARVASCMMQLRRRLYFVLLFLVFLSDIDHMWPALKNPTVSQVCMPCFEGCRNCTGFAREDCLHSLGYVCVAIRLLVNFVRYVTDLP